MLVDGYEIELSKGRKCFGDCPPLVEDAYSQELASLREMGL